MPEGHLESYGKREPVGCAILCPIPACLSLVFSKTGEARRWIPRMGPQDLAGRVGSPQLPDADWPGGLTPPPPPTPVRASAQQF